MLKFYNKEIRTKEEALEDMGAYLSGSCEHSVDDILHDKDFAPLIKAFKLSEYDICKYLDDQGIFECEKCNWWTYPGEGDGEYCDNCIEEDL